MLKFRRYLITKLNTIYRCQPGRLWIAFSVLTLLVVTLQVVEKLQPPRSCWCEQERDLQQNMAQGLSSDLQTPNLLWEDESLQWQRKAVPEPAVTEDISQKHLSLRQEMPLESSPGSQEEHWTQQPVESSKKVEALLVPMRLKSQLPGLRKAAREGPSPSFPERISAVLAEAATSKHIILANRLSTEGSREMSLPGTTQGQVWSQSESQAVASPHLQRGSSVTQLQAVVAPHHQRGSSLTQLQAVVAPHHQRGSSLTQLQAVVAPHHQRGSSLTQLQAVVAPHHQRGSSLTQPQAVIAPHHQRGSSVTQPQAVVAPHHQRGSSVTQPQAVVAPHHQRGSSLTQPQAVASPHHQRGSSLTQPQAVVAPHHQRGSSLTQPIPNSTQPPHPEDSYNTHLETGFFPSQTAAPEVEEVTNRGQQLRGVTSQGKTCKPQTDIVFLKVHKSASSTVMNILFRFGETHNLTFAFPQGGGYQLYYPNHFLARFVQGFSPRSPRRFNILCHHMRFLQPEVQKVVSSSAVYFSILRNPVQLMESSFVYYKGASAFSHVRSLQEFLSDPHRYYNPASGDSHYARNLMTFDFGFNPNGEVSTERVQLMLKAIEASFDFLLISEYFDESMVLLKEMLCWDLDSVVSFPLNIRDNSTKSPLPDSIVEKIKAWNRLDWEIYTHFNRTFWERIERDIGRERMEREVKALRERRAELARTCLQGTGTVVPKDIKDSSLRPLQHGGARILGYNLKEGLEKELDQTCRRLVTPELQYSSALYKRQFPPKTPKPTPSWQGSAPQHRLEGTQN